MTGTSTRQPRPLRFGVVAPITADVPAWRDQLRGLADSGYSTILMPDVPQWQPAPGPALAVAATITDLRVGTWVYASPVRPAWSTAWEAHSLTVLTDGRFEMGIGAGRPGIADQLRELGLPDVPVQKLISNPQDANTIFAATDLGVYRTTDGGDHWLLFGANLPQVQVTDLYIPPDGSFLRIATYGRGVWEISL